MTPSEFNSKFSSYSFPKLGYIKIPKIPIPEEDVKEFQLGNNCSSKDYLLAITKFNFEEKLKSGKIPLDKKGEYWERVNFELGEINKLLFTDYILLVYHIIRFCRKNDILNGLARGSAGGSALLYILNVIGIDPIKHNLLFERFISSARTESKEIDGETYIASESLPDVDIDSDCSLKYKVNEFISSVFPSRTCAIANYGTLQGKVAIKEVCKAYLGYSEDESKLVSDLIESKFGKVDSIFTSLNSNEKFKAWAAKSESTSKASKIACKINGLIKNFSVHASGIVITDNPIEDTLPTQLSSDKKEVTSVDMGISQLYGIKVDNLGLKNLTAIKQTLDLVGKKMEEIDVNDPSIYQFLNTRDQFYGIFQAEEGLGKQVLKSIKPLNIEDISVSIALGRPGSLNFIKDYISYKQTQHSELETKYPKEIHYIIKPTGFVVGYQEQIMAISRKMANFTPQESDKLRKIISKKVTSEMPKWKERFVSQSLLNGYSKDQVEFVWEESFIPASNYSFNRCVYPHETVEYEDGAVIELNRVKIGDRIKAYDTKNKTDHYVRVSDVHLNGVKKLFLWSFEGGGSIKCTENHKFFDGLKMIEINDAYLTNISLLTSEGYKKIESKVFFGDCPTMDLEIDNSDHNYYCNGFVISNSHSTGYAYLTAITAYLKANHPVEFFTALLKNAKNEQDPTLEISTIQSELHHFGIKLLPPHILLSDMDFKIEGSNIRFGLSDIKGIAAKSMQKLINFRDLKHSTKFEVFESSEACKLNIGILSCIIQAGALDDDMKKHNQSRSRLVLESQVWRLLTAREKRFASVHALNCGNDLLVTVLEMNNKLRDEKGQPIIKDSRFETIKKKYQKYKAIFLQNSHSENFANWYYEKKLLGFPYSNNLKSIFGSKNPNIQSIEDVNNLKIEGKAFVIGIIEECREAISKNGKNTRYLKIKLKDEKNSLDILCFNDKIDQCEKLNGRLPEEDDVIIVEGTKKKDCIFADFIKIQEHRVYTKLSELKETAINETDESKPL